MIVYVSIHNALKYLCTLMYFKVLESTFKYYKYIKYIAWYLNTSTSTMAKFKRYLNTSTQEHVLKYKYRCT